METKLIIDAHAARWMLRGALRAASPDDVTPVLTGVYWEIADGWVSITATDRYRVHQLRVPRPRGAHEASFLMSGEQARWIERVAAARASRHSVTATLELTVTTGTPVLPNTAAPAPHITAEVRRAGDTGTDVLAFSTHGIRGNFPPVHRLFPYDVERADTELRASFGMNPRFLGDLAVLRPLGDTSSPVTLWTPRTQQEGNGRALPMVVTDSAVPAEWHARAIIQPNLIQR